MSGRTDADRAKAAATLNYGPDEQVSPMDAEYVEQIAAALAAEREAALAPVLALADELEREATVIAVRAGVPPLDFVRLWRDDAPARIRAAIDTTEETR